MQKLVCPITIYMVKIINGASCTWFNSPNFLCGLTSPTLSRYKLLSISAVNEISLQL